MTKNIVLHDDNHLVKNNLQKVVEKSKLLIDRKYMSIEKFEWEDYVLYLYQIIEYRPLHTLIALHFREVLECFFQAVKLLYKSSKFNDISNQCQQNIKIILQLMYWNGYECFLKNQKNYRNIITQLINQKILILLVDQKNNTLVKNEPRTIVIKQLLIQLNAIADLSKQGTNQNVKLRKQLNQFIIKKLLVQDAHSLLDQIALNWLKNKAQSLQSQNKEYICCRLHFQNLTTSNLSGFSESSDQQFKDYRWPLQNESIKFHLTKTVVGFLNTTGGIIYVGLKEDKSKMVEVKGIKLTLDERRNFLQFLHDDILNGVYPKQFDRVQDQQKFANNQNSQYKKRIRDEFRKQKKQGYDYQINRYIHVDFLDVFEGKTYLNTVGEKGENIYVVRIKIKVGDQKQLYHIINKHGVPEAYLREDKSVRKKNMNEFYQLFYKRMNGSYYNQRQAQKTNDNHSYCRFQPQDNTSK